MTITSDIAWITAVLLLATRLAPVFVLTPVMAVMQIPVRVRVLFVLALSALMVSTTSASVTEAPTSVWELAIAALSELFIGGLLAFGVMAAFAAFLLGGRIIDVQMGFGVASLIDPATRTQAPLLGSFLNIVAVMVFFAIDGHHMMIRGIAFSLQQLPLGVPFVEMNLGALVAQFGAMFVYAVAIVAPAIFGILLLDAGLGVVARTMPQVNIFIVSLPLKIFLGLLLTAISLNYLSPVMENVFQSIFVYWEAIIVR